MVFAVICCSTGIALSVSRWTLSFWPTLSSTISAVRYFFCPMELSDMFFISLRCITENKELRLANSVLLLVTPRDLRGEVGAECEIVRNGQARAGV